MANEVVSKQIWQRFVQEGSLDEMKLSNEIFESWQLCRQNEVNPFDGVATTILTKAELDQKLKENQLMLDLAKPHINQLHNFLKGWRYITILTDKDGCLLLKNGEHSVVHAAEAIFFKEGAKWDEKEVGTNAIGLVTRLKKPIIVKGFEHFSVASQNWNCSAAPILGQDNELIGVLNISSLYPSINYNYVLASVKLAATSISFDWKNKMQKNIELLMSNPRLDDDSIICTPNKIICSLPGKLRPSYQRFIGTPIQKLVEENINLSEIYIPIVKENNIIGYRVPLKTVKNETSLIYNGIKGTSLKFQSVLNEVKRVASKDISVHIYGETGTGKELIAEAIHANSTRASGPFISLNCGAIPEQLLESELFGYEAGAFTGANKKGSKGKFEQANGGTLFLDEIGDMSQSMQVSLLRVLQEKKLTRIGGTDLISVNVRIITAANIDIKDLVKQGKMRLDLFYRIYVYPIRIPPLRERKEDIKSLAKAFFQQKKWYPSWYDRLEKVLLKGQWLGNIRELHNVLERCEILYANQVPTEEELYGLISFPEKMTQAHSHKKTYYFKSQLEIKKIKDALAKHAGNISKAAKELEISRATLYRKLKKYDLS